MSPVEPRDASTVVLLREQAGRLEVFMMRRAQTMAFAPGMYVFPGGRLDDGDARLGAAFNDFPFGVEAKRASTDESGLRALVACAVREVHEETGVQVTDADLVLLDHWVTPAMATRRFDVRFFASLVPHGQEPEAVGTEMDHVMWISPAHALAEFEVDRMRMLRPTLRVLELLSVHEQIDELFASARAREIRPKLPTRTVHADGTDTWAIVDDRTGEVLEADVPAPRYWEGMER